MEALNLLPQLTPSSATASAPHAAAHPTLSLLLLAVRLGHGQHPLALCLGCLHSDVLRALSLLAVLAEQSELLNHLALLLRVDPSTLLLLAPSTHCLHSYASQHEGHSVAAILKLACERCLVGTRFELEAPAVRQGCDTAANMASTGQCQD